MGVTKGKLYIGDNKEVMERLTKDGYKYDVIIADPPYNTGYKGFRYADSFSHREWVEFMRPRLELSKGLLSEEGIICITIDDRELYRLKILMDEIYGEENFVCNLIWDRKSVKNSSKYISIGQEYVLIYRGEKLKGLSKRDVSGDSRYKYKDEDGRLYAKEKLDKSSLEYRKNNDYIIYSEEGEEIYPQNDKEGYDRRKKGGAKIKDWQWRYSYERYCKERAKGTIIIDKAKKGGYKVYTKSYLDEKTNTPHNSIYECPSKTAHQELKGFFNERVFDYAKPVKLIKHLIGLHPKKEGLKVLDIFGGSGTSGQAVVELSESGSKDYEFTLITTNEITIEDEARYLHKKGLIRERPTKKRLKEEWDAEYQELIKTEKYKEVTKLEEYKKEGIANKITKVRLQKVRDGYYNYVKKEEVGGLDYKLEVKSID